MEDPATYGDKEYVPEGAPAKRPPNQRLLYTAGPGLIVSQAGDNVHYALDDEARTALQRAAARPQQDLLKYLAFRVTYQDGVITMRTGPINYVVYDDGAWLHTEEQTEELTTSGMPLPCYVYLRIPMTSVTDVTTDPSVANVVPNGEYTSPTPITVNSVDYNVTTRYSTHYTRPDAGSPPSIHVVETPLAAGDLGSDFAALIAYLDDDAKVQQIHAAAITIPQGFTNYVNDIEVAAV